MIDGTHRQKQGCRESNWSLFFGKVLGGRWPIFRGDLERFNALIRNELAHSNPIDEITRGFLVNYYNLWKIWLCKDEDESDLV